MTIVKPGFPKNQAFQREAGILLPAFRDGWVLCGYYIRFEYFDTIHWQGDYLVKPDKRFYTINVI